MGRMIFPHGEFSNDIEYKLILKCLLTNHLDILIKMFRNYQRG